MEKSAKTSSKKQQTKLGKLSNADIKRIDAAKAVVKFYGQKQSKKDYDSEFDDDKQVFYSMMDNVFESDLIEEDGKHFVFNMKSDDQTKTFSVVKKQRSVIEWDVKKLCDVLDDAGCSLKKSVISIDSKLVDKAGLAKYVKSLGGDIKIFKSFFTMSKHVDEDVLDNFVDIGDVSYDDVMQCCEVKLGKAWYEVSCSSLDGDD